MKNTGALLKSKRESSSLSLSEVALATKINPKILAAIENGDEANLPAKTFLKGFVRSYALFLKMDVDQVMRSFQDEMGGPPPDRMAEVQKSEPSTPASRRRVGDESSSGMRTLAVVVIVVLIGLIIGVRELIEKYQRESIVESTADLKVTPVPNEAPAVVVPPATPADSTGEIAETPEAPETPETAETAEPAAPVQALPAEPAPTAVPSPAPTPTPAPPVVATPAPPAETKPAETKPAETKPAEAKPVVNARPVVAGRPADMIRAPINNLVELRPNQLAPPKPAAPQPAEVKPAETPAAAAAAAPAPAAPASATPPAPAAVSAAAKGEIILEALDKVEVKFQVKGETKRVSLGPTQVHTIHAELPMTLDLSDGGAVNIILNGRERGVPGDLGKPKTIKIP